MTVQSPWIGVALFFGLGLWWAVFPRSAISFYRSFGNRQLERFPTVIRLMGVFALVLAGLSAVRLYPYDAMTRLVAGGL